MNKILNISSYFENVESYINISDIFFADSLKLVEECINLNSLVSVANNVVLVETKTTH